jgi:acetoin utilization protein AcuB
MWKWNPMPIVREWMTLNPCTVEADASLNEAHEIMRERGFRHLPVLERGRLLGLVSQRDLHLIETLRDVNPETVAVREAMISHPYFVAPDARLDEVVAEMAEHKFGAAVVMEEGKVVGMFTTVDALRAFAELLTSKVGGAGEEAHEASEEEPASRSGAARKAGGAKGGGRARSRHAP